MGGDESRITSFRGGGRLPDDADVRRDPWVDRRPVRTKWTEPSREARSGEACCPNRLLVRRTPDAGL